MIAGATEEVKYFKGFKIERVFEDVEQSFFGKVCGRAGGPFICWRMKPSAFECAGNDSHGWEVNRLKMSDPVALFAKGQCVKIEKEMGWHFVELPSEF